MTSHLTSEDLGALLTHGARVSEAHGLRDVRICAEHALLRVSTQIVSLPGLAIVRGQNCALRDVALSGESPEPLFSLHIGLRGAGSAKHPGVPAPLHCETGYADFVRAQSGRYAVSIAAGVSNEVFRLNMTPAYFASLLDRYPALERADDAFARIARGKSTQLGGRRLCGLQRVSELIDDALDCERYGSLRGMFVEAKALELLVRVFSGPQVAPPAPHALKPRALQRMLDARDLLLARLHDPPTLAQLARDLGTNEFTLKRDFKTVFERPVHVFLLERRLEHARELLLDTDRPLKEVAERVGYTQVSHFGAAFRRRFGLTPGQVRKRGNA
jgi:AraC-like DNA-binding protein